MCFFRRKKKSIKPYTDYWMLHPDEYKKFKADFKQKYGMDYGDMLDDIKPH